MDQPGQSLGIIRPGDPKPVPIGKLNLDLAVGDRMAPGFLRGMTHDFDRQETGRLRHRLRRAWRKPWVTQPFEDQIGIQPISPRDLRNRYIRHRRLKTDRPLLVIRPKPPRSTRHPEPPTLHDSRLFECFRKVDPLDEGVRVI